MRDSNCTIGKQHLKSELGCFESKKRIALSGHKMSGDLGLINDQTNSKNPKTTIEHLLMYPSRTTQTELYGFCTFACNQVNFCLSGCVVIL